MPHDADRSERFRSDRPGARRNHEPVPDYGDVRALSLFLLKLIFDSAICK
jgi:hypothetical protein